MENISNKMALAVAGVCSWDQKKFQLGILNGISEGIHMVVGANTSTPPSAALQLQLRHFSLGIHIIAGANADFMEQSCYCSLKNWGGCNNPAA